MLIDTHIHIGDRNECQYIVDNSIYRNIYRLYSCIKPEVISLTNEFLMDVDKYFAIPLFFCESDIVETNHELLKRIENDDKAIPILLVSKNEDVDHLITLLDYNILKEHFTLHDPCDISDRNKSYEYLNDSEGFLLLHTLSKHTVSHVLHLRKEFPNMKIILAHLGRNATCDYSYTSNVIDIISKDEKMYTDVSTISNPDLIRYAVDKMGKERVLYGSDFPFEKDPGIREKDYLQYTLEANLSSDELDWLFSKSSENVLKLSKKK